MAIVFLWLLIADTGPFVVHRLAAALVFAALGWLNLWLARRQPGGWWHDALFAALDAAAVTLALMPVVLWPVTRFPIALFMRDQGFSYFFVLLALAAFQYTPWRMLWVGLAVAGAWAGITLWAVARPETITIGLEASRQFKSDEAWIELYLDPNYLHLDTIRHDIFVFLLVSALLAIVVLRARRMVRSQVAAERARSNLARYFSPNMVDELTAADEPLQAVRTQPVAVLFADIVGFTALSETLPPERVIALLRGFHRRVAQVVFAHRGTLDKYMGDAVMVTFGTPRVGARDAADALACARALVAELERWNEKRSGRGAPPVRVGIGVHYGPAVLGDIGDERRLEYAVIGDTVNVTSRLEALTRDLDAEIVASADLVEAARSQAPDDTAAALAGFEAGAPIGLRGRAEPLAIWLYRRQP